MSDSALAPQFGDARQQQDAATLGMWIFLSTEVLLFGGMFFGYIVCRLANPAAFQAAGSHTLLLLGSVNTAVLLGSSFLVALAVEKVEAGRRFSGASLLLLAAALGVLFLALKGAEYYHEIGDGLLPGPHFTINGAQPAAQELFFVFYFTMTALHGLHVAIGSALLAWFGFRVLLADAPASLSTGVDLTGLYWHFVDIVWVFLFPLFYLLGRS